MNTGFGSGVVGSFVQSWLVWAAAGAATLAMAAAAAAGTSALDKSFRVMRKRLL
jgi:hypothetical protein